MKAVFRILNRIRSGAPIPRDFLPIKGLEHLGLVYQQRVIETAEEFNATWTALNDPRFPNRGHQFFPYLLTADDLAKLGGVPVVVESAPEQPPVEEAAPVEEIADSEAPVEAVPEIETPPTTPTFRLEGKSIYLGDERVAGLYGEEKQLRVFKDELRDAVLDFLNANPPTEP